MKATVPAFGPLPVALHRFFRNLGIEFVPPPPVSPRARSAGLSLSPEQICMPFKRNVANYVDCLARGIDTIFIAGGRGPCRFGLYGTLQKTILGRIAPEVDFCVVDQDRLLDIVDRVAARAPARPSRLGILRLMVEGFRILRLAEENLERAYAAAARMNDPAPAWRMHALFERALERIDDLSRLAGWRTRMREAYAGLPRDRAADLRVGVVGEIYLVVEREAAGDVRSRLATLGASTDAAIHVSEWLLRMACLDLFARLPARRARALAKPWLSREVGGKALHSVAAAVDYAKRGFDGVVHLAPFGCMPEQVARAALERVSADLDLPVLFLGFDEHDADAGLLTRLEAFADLLRFRKGKGR